MQAISFVSFAGLLRTSTHCISSTLLVNVTVNEIAFRLEPQFALSRIKIQIKAMKHVYIQNKQYCRLRLFIYVYLDLKCTPT